MGQVLHGCATTTHAVNRRPVQLFAEALIHLVIHGARQKDRRRLEVARLKQNWVHRPDLEGV